MIEGLDLVRPEYDASDEFDVELFQAESHYIAEGLDLAKCEYDASDEFDAELQADSTDAPEDVDMAYPSFWKDLSRPGDPDPATLTPSTTETNFHGPKVDTCSKLPTNRVPRFRPFADEISSYCERVSGGIWDVVFTRGFVQVI